MLPQQQLITHVRALAERDARLNALMMYGSFTRGEGDAYSDIEFLLFFEDAAFDQVAPRAWIEQVAPVLLDYTNEHGIVEVIFDNLVRGEFHFHPVSDMPMAESWRGVVTFPTLESTLLVDKTGRFAAYLAPLIGPPPERATPAALETLARHFANLWLFGHNVLRRGEHARALEMLNGVHRALLHLARAVEGQTANWLTPSKGLEQDLGADSYARFRACTAPLDPAALSRAYAESWLWGRELLDRVEAQYGIGLPGAVLERLSGLAGALST